MRSKSKHHPSLHGAIKHAPVAQYGLGRPVDPNMDSQPLPSAAPATADNVNTAPDSNSDMSEDA